MLIYKGNIHQNWTSILISDGEIAFPPKPDGYTDKHTYTQTDGRKDISNYRVASLLKITDE